MESKPLDFTGLKIPRDYLYGKEESDMPVTMQDLMQQYIEEVKKYMERIFVVLFCMDPMPEEISDLILILILLSC